MDFQTWKSLDTRNGDLIFVQFTKGLPSSLAHSILRKIDSLKPAEKGVLKAVHLDRLRIQQLSFQSISTQLTSLPVPVSISAH